MNPISAITGQASSLLALGVRAGAYALETGASLLWDVAERIKTPAADETERPSTDQAGVARSGSRSADGRSDDPYEPPPGPPPADDPAPEPAEPHVAAPAPASPAPSVPEPAHVSEEPVLVMESAEAGAEDGAGPEINVAEPWPGYDALPADAVIDALAAQPDAALAVIELYEGFKKNRPSVIQAADRELSRRRPPGS